MPKYDFSSKRDDYLTPTDVIDYVLSKNNLERFMCDVCCTKANIPAHFGYKKDGLYLYDSTKLSDSDGLKGDWFLTNWCNPPFSLCEDFIKKAVKEQKRGCTTYMLIPARTETKYWQKYILESGRATRKNIDVEFLRKGICFLDPETDEPIKMKLKQKDGSYKEVDGVYKNPLALVTFTGEVNDA